MRSPGLTTPGHVASVAYGLYSEPNPFAHDSRRTHTRTRSVGDCTEDPRRDPLRLVVPSASHAVTVVTTEYHKGV